MFARSHHHSIHGALLALLVVCSASCKGTAPTDTPPVEAAPPSAPKEASVAQAVASNRSAAAGSALDGFSRMAQKTGRPTDGATLKSIRHAAHDGFYRFVFDIDGDVIPASELTASDDGRILVVELHGLRMDETGNRPLTTESGEPFGEAVPVANAAPIRSYGRAQVLDDSQLRYEIHLDDGRDFKLHAHTSPVRVIVDIAR